MDEPADAERRALLDVARKVYVYKLMQAKGYGRLANKAQDERTKRLLAGISTGEARDGEYWAEKIGGLSGRPPGLAKASLLDLQVAVMMAILGTRGFLEWATIAEDESVEDLAILAGNLTDRDASALWTRMAADERLHIERIKKQVLGM